MQKIAEATMLKHMKSVQNNYWREWKGKDPWKYNTDAKQLAIRENTMKNLVRSSDRYITMRQNDFEPDLEGMMRKFPSINFTDIEFDIWSAAEKDGLEKSLRNIRSQMIKSVFMRRSWTILIIKLHLRNGKNSEMMSALLSVKNIK
ncbi:hypothetical protein [Candidatus Brachybacter algidus]|uniref:hypothetical protein n=1 Tax=Candidatus Brachybacter algidus TaxID=2982024 RepID=UPI001DB20AC5|nr:hypothetical protein [Candidatus Brachybacter algidus]MBK6447417.1 hypothetical protein [Candidatus Brachybacter algidus]